MAATLEDLKPGLKIKGIVPGQTVSIVDLKWHGSNAVELFYKRADGQPAAQLLYRHDEPDLEVIETKRTWRFEADGHTFRQAAEAYRIHLGHLFDPVLAVHTSLIMPLPHQITAVYGEMLTRQPLRFLLADDPGAGKTIMAGLLIKELVVRGDVKRCLICAPGGLAPQWQDELWFKFQTHFDIISRETIESAVSGNPFTEKERIIIRLDQVARDERLQEKLARTEWDLVIVDEAHKMSAHFWGGKLEETKRYRLGRLLGNVGRHFLLMTATPHNGKEDDFQLFLALLDPDRFAGRFREGVHQVDVSDIMRRMIKEDLYTFEGRKLFPERRAYTVNYELSPAEAELYQAVTAYVREEFNRADQLDDQRKGTVGFALTILQRRLASSPAAIYQSLKRRRERLETRLTELESNQQAALQQDPDGHYFDAEALEDLDDALAEEIEAIEEEIMDSATTALTMAELQAEIDTLAGLEAMAHKVRQTGKDRKWEELAAIIQDDERMVDGNGRRRKLVIFTEHRDTLTYLWERIGTLFGQDLLLATIHGNVPRDKRRAVEDRFRNDPDVYFLLATDAAGEGINLQRAHLMINYDLPWNPNRLEQRFGRIHRIGQTEVCHLWNLVAGQTREGQVYQRLLSKLETESKALEGKVFDVLGLLFEQTPLRKLLVDAIRYGDQPEVQARLEQTVDQAVDQERMRDLLESRSLVTETMDTTQIMRVREEMERYAARRLQPHYIKSFFMQAFESLGGAIREREPGRYRISYVPARIRHRARELGTTVPVWDKYDRVCFDKELIQQPGQPQADFICPGHPLLDTVINLVLEQQVVGYAIEQLVPQHLSRIKTRREELIDKTLAAVHERLTKEINHWDKRAAELRQQEKQGKVNIRLNAELAQRRADELMARLERRKEELAQERQISASPPVVIGGALVVPLGLLLGEQIPPDLRERRITEAIAMQAVIRAETALGNDPRDVSKQNLGYDIESLDPRSGHLRFIEVKGRRAGAETVTVTHNEIMRGFNSPEQFILAIVEVEGGQGREPRYVRNPFPREPHSTEASVNYRLADLLERSTPPE